jgi:hypothetical protein
VLIEFTGAHSSFPFIIYVKMSFNKSISSFCTYSTDTLHTSLPPQAAKKHAHRVDIDMYVTTEGRIARSAIDLSVESYIKEPAWSKKCPHGK